jgi:hypothetical protein
MDVIPPSTALQIAGRAGRYASQFGEGEVTTFKSDDLKLLNTLMNTPVEPVQVLECNPPHAWFRRRRRSVSRRRLFYGYEILWCQRAFSVTRMHD